MRDSGDHRGTIRPRRWRRVFQRSACIGLKHHDCHRDPVIMDRFCDLLERERMIKSFVLEALFKIEQNIFLHRILQQTDQLQLNT